MCKFCNFKWIHSDEQNLRMCMTRNEETVADDYIYCFDGHAKVTENSSVFVIEMIGV